MKSQDIEDNVEDVRRFYEWRGVGIMAILK
jgi:hypothetical protein